MGRKPRHSQEALAKQVGKSPEPNPEPNTLKGTLKPGETKVAHQAAYMVEGLAMNALVGLAFSTKLGNLDLTECFAQMLLNAEETSNGESKSQESILAAQIISTNAIYTDLALLAHSNLKGIGSLRAFDAAGTQSPEQLSCDGGDLGIHSESADCVCQTGEHLEWSAAS